VINSISSQLRRRRRALGWSLGQLARRADTSSATLSRYESGWTRFEIGTLEKLAAALRCELRVELNPLRVQHTRNITRARAVRQLGRLFWDYKLTGKDLKDRQDWVVERVLEFGQLNDIVLLQKLFGRRGFLDSVSAASRLSKRTAAFWSAMLKKEGMTCTRRFSRPKAWNS